MGVQNAELVSALHSHCRGQGFDSPMLHLSHLMRTGYTVYLTEGLIVIVTSIEAKPAT